MQHSDSDDPREEQAARLFSDIYLDRGWMRFLPHTGLGILTALALDGPLTKAEIEPHLEGPHTRDGWTSPAWEPVHQYTDEELAKQYQLHGGRNEPETAAAANADEAAERARHLADFERYSQGLGIPSVRTTADVLTYMLACRLILADEGDGVEHVDSDDQDELRYMLNREAPLPEEVLPLSEAERSSEAGIRWRRLHEPTAQAIIRLFEPDGAQLERRRTSLQRLARELDVDVESARAGLLNLLSEGDFSATIDLERAMEHKVFEIVVDWDAFVEGRMSISHERSDEGDQ